MIAYLLKVTLCSALFWAVYHFLLADQKMHVFSRFYLLFALVFSGVAPLISIELPAIKPDSISSSEQIVKYIDIGSKTTLLPSVSAQPTVLFEQNIPLETMLWTIYWIVTTFLLFRFLRNIRHILTKINRNKVVDNEQFKVVLLAENATPHSFLNYVFMSREDYESRSIEREILCHENTHVIQKHTLDILFIELLIIFLWFNPVLFLYRKAIKLNHEFLADGRVVHTYQNPTTYQYLLLNKTLQANGLQLTSQFNFLITKKRLVMMNKITTPARAWATQMAVSVIFVAITFAFSDLSLAQNPAPTPSTEKGVSQAVVKEYQSIGDKYITKKNGKIYIGSPTNEELLRLEVLFKSMSKDQQEQQRFKVFPSPILPKSPPTEKEFESYKNPKGYGVWIDGKKIKNSILDSYKASDFALAFVSRLYPNAQKTIGYKYKFQLDLETDVYYEKQKAKTPKIPMMLFVNNKMQEGK